MNRTRWLVLLLLAGTLAGGCDHPFEPFQENTAGPFSISGYLDLKADTQWIRVMPVRQQQLAEPAPIDAVVTLEHMGTGRVVTLRDSLFTFTDPRLNSVAYAHNFWTAEPIQPGAVYRLEAVRSDGATTTALIEMPSDPEVTLFHDPAPYRYGDVSRILVRAEHLLYIDLVYTVWSSRFGRAGDPFVVRQHPFRTTPAGSWEFRLSPDSLMQPGLFDVRRLEARVALTRSDWPYVPGLSALDLAVPGRIPSNVENGLGFVGGLALWRIPLAGCTLIEAGPDGTIDCTTILDASSASIAGRVAPPVCGNAMNLVRVRLTERFAGGGAVVRELKTDWHGVYGFAGVQPTSDLSLEFDTGSSVVTADVPPLAPGERYVVPEVSLPTGGCAPL